MVLRLQMSISLLKSSVAVKWLNRVGHSVGYGKAGVQKSPPSKAKRSKLEANAKPGVVSEKVTGKRLDVSKAKKIKKILTPKRPFSLEELRKMQIKELESLMDEMRLR